MKMKKNALYFNQVESVPQNGISPLNGSVLLKNIHLPIVKKEKVSKWVISVNIREDLLILNMCLYLLSERNTKDTRENDSLVELSNKTHKVNKKVSALANDILIKIKNTIKKIYRGAENKDIAIAWCDRVWESDEVGRLFNSIKKTNLEFLAQQILYINFIERKQPLHSTMAWLADEKLHNDFFSLLEKTNAEELLEIVADDAYRCVKILKCYR